MIRSYDGMEPTIADSAYVDPAATVIGEVTIEADASVWPNAVLRGDHGEIVVREGANVQDNAVCHEGTEIGRYATLGHGAIVHASVVAERGLVGMNAVVLDGSVVGERAVVAASSLVREGTEIPPRTLVAGNPAEVRRELEDASWSHAADAYVEYARTHEETSEVLHERWPPDE